MSQSFFGQFLVEKKIITEDVLLESLIEQIENSQSVLKISFEKKLIPQKNILEILSVQQKEGCDFKSAAKQLNFWNDSFDKTIMDILKVTRKSLGEILINNGKIDLKKLTESLDEFLSQKNDLSEELKEDFVTIDLENLMEFRDQFDERKLKAIKSALVFVKDNVANDLDSRLKMFSNAFKIIQAISGYLFILKLNLLHNLIDKIARVLSDYIEKSSSYLGKEVFIADLLIRAINLSWDLRESIMDNQTESKFYLDEKSKKYYIETMKSLESI